MAPSRRFGRFRERDGAVPTRVLHWGMDAVYIGLASALPVYAATRMVSDAKTRARWGAYVRDIPARFGRRLPRQRERPGIWIHGVSVGEVKAAARLIEEIERRVPNVEVVISVTTDTGNRVARKRYPHHRIEFYPPDISWIVRDSLRALRPDLVILVESEFWPNFLCAANDQDIPVVLVNGRMSERSARRFKSLSAFSRPMLQSLHHVFAQLPAYADRFEALGVPKSQISVTGNMKFDNIPFGQDDGRRAYFNHLLAIADGEPTIVAGSTHPGEERALARLHRRLNEAGHAHRVIVAPRHPARRESVEADIRREGVSSSRRSEVAEGQQVSGSFVLLDTVGELEQVYGLADIVFVGGTLVPHGGQNVMEPASLGKPVIVGPHVGNFRGEVAMLVQAGGVRVVQNEDALFTVLSEWLADSTIPRDMGHASLRAISDSKGATDRNVAGIVPLLDQLAAAYRPDALSPSAVDVRVTS